RGAAATEAKPAGGVARRPVGVQIAATHARGLDGQHDLTRAGRRIRKFLHLELAIPQEDDATHDEPPWRQNCTLTEYTSALFMTSPIITEAVRALIERRDLSRLEAAAAMDAIMSGAATNAQIAAFLTALRMKGETVEELIGFAQVMRQKVVRIRTRGDEVAALTGTDREMLIDTCGTGGDATGTFNVSTATAFVVAGAGLRVAKHGNRSVSSLCGSADVVEALGINLELTPPKVARCVDEARIGFLYAPLLHTAMKHVMPARREMGIRTVFNILGPLTN